MLVACSSSEPSEEDDEGGGGSGASSVATGGGANVGGGTAAVELPAGCFFGAAACHPMTNQNCGPDEACGMGIDGNGAVELVCHPGPNTQQLSQACDGVNGPFCAGGLSCHQGACVPMCCSDADCAGVPCNPLDPVSGGLGACAAPPMCQGAGGPCSAPADCCSMDCHAGHCH